MQLPGTRNLHTARQHSKGSPYIGGPLIVRLHAARQRPKGSPLAKGSWQRSCLRVLTKSRKNEALIRNDGVYVISGIFCRAHEGRALCAKQAEVSPVSNKSHKHALRAMWIDDCELWVKMHSRPDRWPQIVRFASGRADSLANRRFVNDQRGCERTTKVLSQPLLAIDTVPVCPIRPAHAICYGNRTEIFVPLPSSLESEICAL